MNSKKLFKNHYKAIAMTTFLAAPLSSFAAVGSFETPPAYQALAEIAEASLNENIIQLSSGPYLRAGSHQFGSLWTRDFCFSVPGLLAMGRTDVVKNQITRLISTIGEEGLVPRGMDSISPSRRVFAYTVTRALRRFVKVPALSEPLKPEYRGEHGTIAVDSNMLVILAARSYVEATGDTAWWTEHEREFVHMYHYYNRHRDTYGFIIQPKYGDWQDSASREGRTAYLSILDQVVTEKLKKFPAFRLTEEIIAARRRNVEDVFYVPSLGIYRAHEQLDHIGLDANLLAITLGYARIAGHDPQVLWQSLKQHAIWQGAYGPGFPTYPNYPQNWISFTTKAAGLRHYHDELYWSWLIAMSGRVAYCMGDRVEGDAIFTRLQSMAVRDGAISEIYDPNNGLNSFGILRYQSEEPFSWGAAVTISSLNYAAKGCSEGF